MKIINNICISNSSYIKNEEDFDYKISNIKIDWNLLLLKTKQYGSESEKNIENNITINNNKILKNNKKKGRNQKKKKRILYILF